MRVLLRLVEYSLERRALFILTAVLNGLIHCAACGHPPSYRQRHRRGPRQRPRRAGSHSGPDRTSRVDQAVLGYLALYMAERSDERRTTGCGATFSTSSRALTSGSTTGRRPETSCPGHGGHRRHRKVHFDRLPARHIRTGLLHPADCRHDHHRVAHGARRSRLLHPRLVGGRKAGRQPVPRQQAHLPRNRADEYAGAGRPRRHENDQGAGLSGLRGRAVQGAAARSPQTPFSPVSCPSPGMPS